MNLEQATESTLAKAFTRFAMPVLLTVIGVLGGWVLTDIRSELKEQGAGQVDLSREVQQVDRKVDKVDAKTELLNAKVDNGLVWRITDLERRINQVEKDTTP